MIRNSLLFCLTLGLANAQWQFRVPNEEKDLAQNWTVGDTMNIAWSAVQNVYPDEKIFQKGKWDLHVTWFSSDGFQQLITPKVDLTVRGSYNWKIDISNDTAKTDNRFVLRFAPATDPPKYIPDSNESPSRGFYIFPQKEESTTSSSATSTATESSSATSTGSATSTPTSEGSKTDNTSSSNEGSKTPIGAIVGGVVGGIAALALIAVAALLFMRNRKHKRDTVTAQYAAQPQDYSATPVAELRNTAYHGTGQAYDPAPEYKYGMTAPVQQQQPYSTMPSELPTTNAPPVELDSGAGHRQY